MTQTTEREFLSVADTAKLIRQALKVRFPAQKFSVRSHRYAGGASIDVNWTDGPTPADVEQITDGFAGGRFDGMIDMAYNVTSWLEEDGSAHVAENRGTLGSRGIDPGCVQDPQTGGARLVYFGADYVFTNRTHSDEFSQYMAGLAVRNGRVAHPMQCEGCGNWMSDQDCWTIADPSRGSVRFICQPECAVRAAGRHYTAS